MSQESSNTPAATTSNEREPMSAQLKKAQREERKKAKEEKRSVNKDEAIKAKEERRLKLVCDIVTNHVTTEDLSQNIEILLMFINI